MNGAHFLHRPIVFHPPARAVHPPSWLEHTPFAFWLMEALHPGIFVELGCHSGNSYSSFAQAVQTLGLATACYAVDTWRGDPHAGGFDQRVFEEWSEYHDRRFSAFSRLIRATFDEARPHFSDRSIDLLHIDGYHTFEASAHDFETWRTAMSSRGVVLLHDINVRDRDFGVWRLWEQLRADYPSFEFQHGHGLGVLGVGTDLPDAVRWLLSIDEGDASAVRMFFERLGAVVLGRYTTAEAERIARHDLEARDERLAGVTREVVALKAENAALRDALAATKATAAAHEAEIEQLASRLERYDRQRVYPTIVIVSHVGPWRPRAGNEYRVNRLLHWYRRQQYRIIPVIAPLPGEELSREALDAIAATFGNVVQVHRDGWIEHDLRDVPDGLAALPARARPLHEPGRRFAAPDRELDVDRTFCHDAVVSTVLHLQQSLGPHVLQVEYIWMTRLLPLVQTDVLKVVDTHDVFSSIEQKVRRFGVHDRAVDPREEADRLNRADLIIAIQEEERLELQRLAPAVPVITAGVDFEVIDAAGGSIDGRVLYVASNNPRNVKGLRDFLTLAWPLVRRRVPGAELIVVGGVGTALGGTAFPRVTIAGRVDDVAALYREAALVINPVVAGTGAKIKTIEALAHLRPIVTWPAGVDGLDARLAARCVTVRDWYRFASAVVEALTTRRDRCFTAEDRAVIADVLSPAQVYAQLDAAYAAFFDRYRAAAPAAATPVPIPDVAHAD